MSLSEEKDGWEVYRGSLASKSLPPAEEELPLFPVSSPMNLRFADREIRDPPTVENRDKVLQHSREEQDSIPSPPSYLFPDYQWAPVTSSTPLAQHLPSPAHTILRRQQKRSYLEKVNGPKEKAFRCWYLTGSVNAQDGTM